MPEKFTPGPWRATTHITDSINIWIEDYGSPCIRRIAIIDDGAGIKNPVANANLIAAAPDLYDACDKYRKGCLFLVEGWQGECTRCPMCAVLKKARGEE